jgi:DNA-binding transcriptional LysR family regulator
MELRHLRYFVAVAEELHFGRAAERIGIEQSPLSRAIRELEEDIGVRLFTRNSRSTRITPAGETFLVEARRILKAVSHARKATVAVATGARARVRIGVSDSIAQPRLARLLARCRVEQPNVEFIVIDRSERRQASGLREGLIDVGLAPSPVCTDGLRSEPLWTDSISVLLPPHHHLTSVRQITTAEVFRESKVVYHPDFRNVFESRRTHSSSGESTRFPSLMSATSLPMLLEMVAAGFSVGIALAAQVDTLRRADVVVRSLVDPTALITTHAILRAEESSENISLFLQRARG